MTLHTQEQQRETRLREIERALQFDPDHPYRRQDLTDKKDEADERAA